MDRALANKVWKRARSCCEYCQFESRLIITQFEIDHILAEKHGGKTVLENLALSCFWCNSYKGANIAGIDPHTGRITRLFNPRKDRWSKHFLWSGMMLLGVAAVGRTTVEVLRMNDPWTLALRAPLITGGVFPPEILK